MNDLKRIVFKSLLWLSTVMLVLILISAAFLQVLLVQDQVRENAQATFLQVGQILRENEADLQQLSQDYRETCLLNAETIAYIVQHHPEILGDVSEFRMLARMIEVDEIHIFDETGTIFTGSHPEYFGYTFDTGEQIGYFRPLLEDKTLRLCQDITPNTAESKLVQYSALWSPDGQFIVQVGMYPEAVLEVTEKNSLSHVFSLLQGDPSVDLYAVNAVTNTILGSTTGGDNGKHMSQLGFQQGDLERLMSGGHATVSGVDSFCVFTRSGDTVLGYVISLDQMYRNIPLYTGILAAALALIEAIIMIVVAQFINHYIIRSIGQINGKLRSITEGDLDQRADVENSREFTELSAHINAMVMSLLANTDKMSFVLNRTNMRIGVYEYNEQMKTVRYTEHIPHILDVDQQTMHQLSANHRVFQSYIDKLRQEPVAGEDNVYRFVGRSEMYIRLEEVMSGSDRLGVVMDVTEEITTRLRIEAERDIDLLTGLYSRFGLERQLVRTFADHVDRSHGALIMIDSDGLKEVNDTYGHAAGDLYLKKIADVLRDFGSAKHLAARQSGDEFVVMIYGYANESAVMADLMRMRELPKTTFLSLENGTEIPVRFSFGYVLTVGRQDYQTMLSEADAYMYAVKRKRKKALRSGLPVPDEFTV